MAAGLQQFSVDGKELPVIELDDGRHILLLPADPDLLGALTTSGKISLRGFPDLGAVEANSASGLSVRIYEVDSTFLETCKSGRGVLGLPVSPSGCLNGLDQALSDGSIRILGAVPA